MIKVLVITDEKEKWIEIFKANCIVKESSLRGEEETTLKNEFIEMKIFTGGVETLNRYAATAVILDKKIGTKVE